MEFFHGFPSTNKRVQAEHTPYWLPSSLTTFMMLGKASRMAASECGTIIFKKVVCTYFNQRIHGNKSSPMLHLSLCGAIITTLTVCNLSCMCMTRSITRSISYTYIPAGASIYFESTTLQDCPSVPSINFWLHCFLCMEGLKLIKLPLTLMLIFSAPSYRRGP